MARHFEYESIPYELRTPAWNEPTPYTRKKPVDYGFNTKKKHKEKPVYHGTFYSKESSVFTRFVTFAILIAFLVGLLFF